MATVKITDLPYITSLQPNTANTVLVGVDVPGDYTGQMTLTTLAHGLYSNNFLYVGNNDILLANAVGQFTGNAEPYLQISLHNNDANGSGDLVVTGDTGTDTTHYIDLGIQGSNLSQGNLKPLDSYLLSVGDTSSTPGGNLIIGTDTPNRNVDIILGGHETNNVAAQFLYGQGFKLTQKPLIFADGTSQNSAVAYTGVDSRITANAATINGSITSNVATINGSITANATSANSVINTRVSANVATINGSITSNISTQNTFTQAAFDKANNALANTTGVFNGSLTITGTISTANVTINNDIVLNDAGVYQYSTANNTTVTQLTSKSTAVTCNGRTGQITTNSASLAKGVGVSFTVNNSQIVSAKDVVIVNLASGGTLNSYQVAVDAVAPGSFSICIVNNGSGPLAEALVINYAIIRVN